jgi:hypothetical protein
LIWNLEFHLKINTFKTLNWNIFYKRYFELCIMGVDLWLFVNGWVLLGFGFILALHIKTLSFERTINLKVKSLKLKR